MRRLALALIVASLAGGCAAVRPPEGRPSMERPLLTTGYCACGSCCGWRRSCLLQPVYAAGPRRGEPKAVGVTSSGTHARRGTIAADTARYPYGTVMYVPGYGYGRVEDTGSAIRDDHIDLFFPSHREAIDWGRRNRVVRIWLPRGATSAGRTGR